MKIRAGAYRPAGIQPCTRSQLINSIDILRARRATGLMTRDNYRTVNNITRVSIRRRNNETGPDAGSRQH
ncbi:hypothetical protein DMI60_16320 [Escherichia coli]|nr:hypothetical protein [Escherichia coli]